MRKSLLTTASIGAMIALLPAYAAAQPYAAESYAEVDGDVFSNDDVTDGGSLRENLIEDSYGDSSGIQQVQQNNGSMNAMGIATDVMVNIDATNSAEDILSTAVVTGGITDNGTVRQFDDGHFDPERLNEIDDSFDSAEGLYSVQQNNGDVNVMGIANSVVAMTEDDDIGTIQSNAWVIGPSFNSFNPWLNGSEGGSPELWAHDEGDVTRVNEIDDSFDRFEGFASVQQNNGSQNIMGVANSIIGVEGATVEEANQMVWSTGGWDDSVGNYDDRQAQIDGIATHDYGTDRFNEIDDSFEYSSGWLNVQQNNGNANTLSMANAVMGQAEDLLGNTEAQSVNQEVRSGGSVADVTTYNGYTVETDWVHVGRGYYYPVQVLNPSVRENVITDETARESEGVFNVQQNNGDVNSISQSTAVMATVGDGDQIGDLHQSVQTNGSVSNFTDVAESIIDMKSERTNVINGDSFNGFDGLSTVQQNNGDGNVIASSMAVVAMLDDSNGGDTGSNPSQGDTLQQVSTWGLVQDVEQIVDYQHHEGGPGERSNIIESAYEYGFDGIAVAQQNNGSANVMGSAMGIQVSSRTDYDSNLEYLTQEISTEGVVDFQNQSDDRWYESNHSDRDNSISDAFEHSDGLAVVQQNNGDANVMGNAVGVFVSYRADDIDGLSTMDVDTVGTVQNNDLRSRHPDAGDFGSDRDNYISNDAFDHFGGLASVQQNNGNANVLGTAIAINASFSPAQGATDGPLHVSTTGTGTVAHNAVLIDEDAERGNSIDRSFDRFSGVGSVMQNNGDVNVLGSAVSVAVHEDNGGPGFGPVVSATTLSGTVSGNTVTVTCGNHCSGPTYGNAITASFEGASGVGSVIQNNGSANVIQSAISVTVNGDL